MISPFLKKDLKKSLLSHPVKHDNLFGQDFEKVTDQVIKEHTATSKIVHNAKPQKFGQPSVSG